MPSREIFESVGKVIADIVYKNGISQYWSFLTWYFLHINMNINSER